MMKTFERILLIFSLLALTATIVFVVIQWKKDSDLWRSLKLAVAKSELLNLVK